MLSVRICVVFAVWACGFLRQRFLLLRRDGKAGGAEEPGVVFEGGGAGVCSIRLAGFPVIGFAGGNIEKSGTKALCDRYCDGFDEVLAVIREHDDHCAIVCRTFFSVLRSEIFAAPSLATDSDGTETALSFTP